MKRIVSSFLIVILFVGLMTGCNKNELGMYKISNEMSLITAVEQEGFLEYSFDFASMFDEDSEEYESNKEAYDLLQKQNSLMNLNKIYYRSSVDQKSSVLSGEYYIIGKDNKELTLIELRMVNEKFYVSYDGVAELMLPYFTDADIKDTKLLEVLKAADGFIEFDMAELNNMGNPANPMGMSTMQMQNNYNLNDRYAFIKDVQDDLDKLMNETMKDFTTDKVTKTYNKSLGSDMYTYTINSDDMIDISLGFAQYFLDHFSEFKEFYFVLLDNVSLMVAYDEIHIWEPGCRGLH